MTNELWDQLVEAGWTPPPELWLPVAEAEEENGAFFLVKLQDPDDPDPRAWLAWLAYRDANGGWYDEYEEDVEEKTGWRVTAWCPEPGFAENPEDYSLAARRILRKFLVSRAECEAEERNAHRANDGRL